MAKKKLNHKKKRITLDLENDIFVFFKDMSELNGIPVKNIIELVIKNFYLKNNDKSNNDKIIKLIP